MSVKETYYLIDYENTNENGLSGCERLGEHDHIFLFYTKNASKISLEKLSNCNHTNFHLHKILDGKQSLDMHLVSYLGHLIGKNESKCCNYVIISKDKDFDNIILFWEEDFKKKKNNSKIIRQGQIATTQKQKKAPSKKNQLNTEIQQALSNAGYNNTENDIGDITHIVVKHYKDDKFLSNVHNELRATYHKGYDDIYRNIRPILKKYSKQ